MGTDVDLLLAKMYRADKIATALDTIRRGFDLTEDELGELEDMGIDSVALMEEVKDEHITS